MITVLDQHESAVLPASDRLETGMHLTQPEFERRYNLHPDLKKAELINGFVIMGSPVSIAHGSLENHFGAWLGYYFARLGRHKVVHNTTLRIDHHNEVQPDIAVIDSGRSSGKPSLFIEEPPRLIVEIASSSRMYDRYEKYDLYERCRVGEYVLCSIEEGRVFWFALGSEGFREIADENGLLKSRGFPGLWLNSERLVNGDMEGVFRDLNSGLESQEFLKFRAETLAQR